MSGHKAKPDIEGIETAVDLVVSDDPAGHKAKPDIEGIETVWARPRPSFRRVTKPSPTSRA